MFKQHIYCTTLLLSSLCGAANLAFAAEASPTGINNAAQASSGATAVGKEGFQATQATPADLIEEPHIATKITLGGLFASGNAKSLAITGAGQFGWDYLTHRLQLAFAMNYAQSSVNGAPLQNTVYNYTGFGRYDEFLIPNLSGFFATTARHDPFQGLELRLNVDVGAAYFFLKEEKQELTGEAGYDLQYDARTDAQISTGADPNTTRHNARIASRYVNKINDYVTFGAGIEYIQSVQEARLFRVNWDANLTTKIADKFSLAVTVLYKYDNAPLEGIIPTDVISSLALSYDLF